MTMPKSLQLDVSSRCLYLSPAFCLFWSRTIVKSRFLHLSRDRVCSNPCFYTVGIAVTWPSVVCGIMLNNTIMKICAIKKILAFLVSKTSGLGCIN